MDNIFEPLIKLPAKDEKDFANFIMLARNKMILPPKESTKNAVAANKNKIDVLLKERNISEAIKQLRQLAYDEFLKEEALFNGYILKEICKKYETPKNLIEHISSQLHSLNGVSQDNFKQKLIEYFGAYSGAISPYIYQLCLSNTQSRRSRAGKVFEGIIYYLYDYFEFSYDSQSTIGRKSFSDLKLGKVVDSILPSKEAFSQFRNKTIVGSMKTTLRERWQEVVEEISRSNLPNIYLLTVDENIAANKAKQMAEHNIVLVVLKNVKLQQDLNEMRNIIDFETYFNVEIPQIMDYWVKNA